jgi:hypothetical protein
MVFPDQISFGGKKKKTSSRFVGISLSGIFWWITKIEATDFWVKIKSQNQHGGKYGKPGRVGGQNV